MTVAEDTVRLEANIRQYFDIADGVVEGDIFALFVDDCEVYFPKFGIAKGHDDLREAFAGISTLIRSTVHDQEGFRYIRAGETIVVEGTTHGTSADGVSWQGGVTPGGRFCSVFDGRDGLIARMFVYLDPDRANADADRYPWPVSSDRSY